MHVIIFYQELNVTLSVKTDLVVGGVETTFRLTSEQTQDDNPDNDMQTVSLIVERRADLTVSVYVQEVCMSFGLKQKRGMIL